jgi:hypothetical protein
MKYRVTAKFIEARLPEFYQALTDGSVENQRPDGREIVASMKRARITAPGEIVWYETCYCLAPLKHERETVYDRFLSSISTSEVDEYRKLNCGTSFWSYLESVAGPGHSSEQKD